MNGVKKRIGLINKYCDGLSIGDTVQVDYLMGGPWHTIPNGSVGKVIKKKPSKTAWYIDDTAKVTVEFEDGRVKTFGNHQLKRVNQ